MTIREHLDKKRQAGMVIMLVGFIIMALCTFFYPRLFGWFSLPLFGFLPVFGYAFLIRCPKCRHRIGLHVLQKGPSLTRIPSWFDHCPRCHVKFDGQI